MVVLAIHRHESATGAHVSPHLEHPFLFPPHSIPLGCSRAPPALSAHIMHQTCTVICFTYGNAQVSHAILSDHPTWASLVAQLEKNPRAMRETWVRSLG